MKFTRSGLPVKLVGVRADLNRIEALKLEYPVIKMSASDKIIELEQTP